MKQKITNLRCWMLFAFILCVSISYAATTLYPKVGGIYYYFDSSTKEAKVEYHTFPGSTAMSLTDYTGNIVIPSTVTYDNEEYTVTEIGSYAFHDCVNLTSVTLPLTIKTIGNGAFLVVLVYPK